MDGFVFDALTAVWFGILTSLSPCPLATNIAAVSFIGKQVDRNGAALLNGVAYTAGRTITYTVLGAVLISGTHLIPRVSMFLQGHMQVVVGPVLVITGVFLLGIVKVPGVSAVLPYSVQERLAKYGWSGALFLGIVFALAFCPVSAGLFFGSTFGIALKRSSRVLVPLLYGVGTALPVVVFALVIAFSANAVGTVFNRLTVFEKWARKASAVIIIAAGIFLLIKSV